MIPIALYKANREKENKWRSNESCNLDTKLGMV